MQCRLIRKLVNYNNIPRHAVPSVLPKYINYDVPVVDLFQNGDQNVFGVIGNVALEDVFKVTPPEDKIFHIPTYNFTSGGLIFFPNTVVFRHMGATNPDNEFRLAVIKAVRGRGINCFTDSNDIFIDVGGKYKKFIGAGYTPYESGYGSYRAFISFTMDYNIMEQYLRIDTDKFNSREFDSLSNIIGSLDQVGIGLDLMDDILYRFALEMNYTYVDSTYTEEEDSMLRQAEAIYRERHSVAQY